MDAAGHLYGTTYAGGTIDYGTVFELTPNATKTTWTETVLYSFGHIDGADPLGGADHGRGGEPLWHDGDGWRL